MTEYTDGAAAAGDTPSRGSFPFREIIVGVRAASRFEQAMADVEATILGIGESAKRAGDALRAFARPFEAAHWRAIRADYDAHGRTRPDGRPRRSGRRHRGMRAWATRHG